MLPCLRGGSALVLWFLTAYVAPPVHADITVYYQKQQSLAMLATQTSTVSAGANYTGLAAFNPSTLAAPALPSPVPSSAFDIQLGTVDTMNNASMPHAGPFYGFSIEMSVAGQIIGKNGTNIYPPFLNLVSQITERSGEIHIRVGGNTQESAELVQSTPNNTLIAKDLSQGTTGTTHTPVIQFTDELLYLMSNISSMLPVKWFLGVPFNDTQNLRLAIVQDGGAILGDNLIGLQAGNEPDFYDENGRRPVNSYGPYDYFGDIGLLVTALEDPQYNAVRDLLIVPSIMDIWSPQEVWDTGLITNFTSSIKYMSVERYPNNNCAAAFNTGPPLNPQDVLPSYLNHQDIQGLIAYYLSSTAYAQQMNKPFIMFETNTASCGGFPGISNSYASALWAVDYGLQMAWGNFSEALLHFGGTSVLYNPFIPAPTNQQSYRQWTVGPIYYAMLAVAEAIGTSGVAQVVDLYANSASTYTPAYAIYEGANPARVALINYNDDPTGAAAYTASISVPSGMTLSSVQVKYLAAPSIAVLGENVTWAGQNFGGIYQGDGRPMGDVNITTVQCNNNICPVYVPAPGMALVFLTSTALSESDNGSTMTYPTTVYTKAKNTATVDPSVLSTSNGHNGQTFQDLGSTSSGSKSGAAVTAKISVVMITAMFGGVGLLLCRLR